MDDKYIKGEDAFAVLTEYYHHKLGVQHEALREALFRVPAADVRPVIRARWEHIEQIEGHAMGECSNCLKVRIVDNFCPNCGADMRDDEPAIS